MDIINCYNICLFLAFLYIYSCVPEWQCDRDFDGPRQSDSELINVRQDYDTECSPDVDVRSDYDRDQSFVCCRNQDVILEELTTRDCSDQPNHV